MNRLQNWNLTSTNQLAFLPMALLLLPVVLLILKQQETSCMNF
ncbi:hypothetical protein VRU48_08620 [Pedobacter sp. KR3-3]|uniref:Uncharacterized protein n=1 Tax=Pedobacter albus TaxID=3113905 RepID=A0ABU7I6R8_9SPHI|nr:hypothetical protein [Pedobacter sp. KR3-3]MEE1945168.1 hypothetical protein [Pedobacter sp. KR3-3]